MLKKKKTLALYVFIIILLIVVGVIVAHNIAKNENTKRRTMNITVVPLSQTCMEQVNQLKYLGGTAFLERYSVAEDIKDILADSDAIEGYSNPIDEYYIPKIKSDIAYAIIREFERCYYFVWKEEYENIIKCIEEKCKTKNELEKIKNLNKQNQSCIDEFENIQNLEVNLNDTSGAYYMYLRGKLYRKYSFRLIAEYYNETPYVYMDRDYSKIIIP